MKPTQALLNEILDEARPLIGQGKVADYIPALANVPASKLGIAVCYNDGEIIEAGDSQEGFSIQSISKVLALTLAMTLYEPEEIWTRVGKEPSGHAFNSMIQLELENGIPRNPFINAGALIVSDLLHSRLSAPQYRMLELVRQLSQNPTIIYDKIVASSEMQHSDRNASIAYLMRSFGNFSNEVMPVLTNYFSYCALKMSCVDLARTFSYLANTGGPLGAEQGIISQTQCKQMNALLATCGLYDGAGEFAYRVGMPGKSGVGGGIIAVVPGEMTVAVWSPELDHSGNSLAGTAVLEMFAERAGRSIF
ncbi:Glutaminase 2 [Photobacterium damselae subsp. piscicida]|uniref:Glutaminase n=1 Tax=Photobacterium damsela subsp. piscicida TaxID=38294 RepID=A0A1V1V6E8_PHODP|nr:glutaminase B [Photobacterium damselae]MBE8128364.1 glutaminase B [Photobacterium damselae subsp. piscicida]PSV75113.1 glutaminase [Photobacterium damselae]PSW78046.1 glutaminase [Photobacterium damselae]QOD53073.1 glutaminase B [Photobacterium damselae subsp. piscicida]QOD56914.1 glutaminase B [Photobacterium damselae subsp. piscicida]